MRLTNLIRVLLVGLLVAVVLACGLLYIVSLDLATAYPRHAPLRLHFFVATLVGLAPVIVAGKATWQFIGLVDRGETFSPAAVRLLRLLKWLAASVAVYLCGGFVAVWWVLLPDASPSVFLAWLMAEIVAVFLLALLALLERLFAAALELRQDNELTV